MIDEMERSIHDALCVVRRVVESNQVCPGGGACEAALSIYLGMILLCLFRLMNSQLILLFLENFATTLSSREQIAIAEFAKSLLVIPKTLAVNAALDSTDLVARLRALHNMSQSVADKDNLKYFGLDLYKGILI